MVAKEGIMTEASRPLPLVLIQADNRVSSVFDVTRPGRKGEVARWMIASGVGDNTSVIPKSGNNCGLGPCVLQT